MIKRLIKQLTVCLLVGTLWLGMTSCSRLKADIPQHIVAAAVTQQAQQEQNTLWQQLSSSTTEKAPTLSVRKVKVNRVRTVKVVSDLAYEVTGTYQYKLRYPNRSAVKQSQVPFDLIVQGSSETHEWRLLQRGVEGQGDRSWRWLPLTEEAA